MELPKIVKGWVYWPVSAARGVGQTPPQTSGMKVRVGVTEESCGEGGGRICLTIKSWASRQCGGSGEILKPSPLTIFRLPTLGLLKIKDQISSKAQKRKEPKLIRDAEVVLKLALNSRSDRVLNAFSCSFACTLRNRVIGPLSRYTYLCIYYTLYVYTIYLCTYGCVPIFADR